ncbi:MAG: IS6 family transposase [Pseudoruegeria sp.]
MKFGCARVPFSYQDVVDLLSERDLNGDRPTVFRWVLKLGPELSKRTEKHLSRSSQNWHVDETYIRGGGKWCYLWRTIDVNGQLVDFRLTARRDAKAARASLNKAIERVRLDRPTSICTGKTPTYRKVIREMNRRYDPHFDHITHINKKYRNNRVESDHAALKKLLGYQQSFRSLRHAKTTLQGMEAIRMIKIRHIQNPQPSVRREVAFATQLFGLAA